MNSQLKRILKYGLIGFWRNGWISIAAIFTMVLALFVIGSLIFSSALFNSTLERIKNKVDISVYFKDATEEKDIIAVKEILSSLPQVKEADYVSRQRALDEFREKHKNNALIIQSLDELGSNPFKANINIKAKDPAYYEAISKFLNEGEFSGAIEKINYYQNKAVIERLSEILDVSQRTGFIAGLILAFIAVSVTFNTIRLAIYNSREEIKVMRLVGASNNFVRGPFLFEGALYGLISGFIALIIFLPLTYWLGPKTLAFFGGPNIYDYYLANFLRFFLILVIGGAFLGVISSLIATFRYLKD
ncbi:MAG: hypothetical protein A3H02_00815 [Candidatus Niyogibacteria bacterium RIFCSPLOWO2_12_FULL_41_13]|uniref:Cell division protein FtsX n=1 Tax=Candidatus Niyogibacteria bacterium RIFCSPLOWO2_12_FULL_41_13 TaxID=1801726 RepID=A0A1G2F395_9BACT|nr:MAG: hypothetical protein A3H02_00815 [Candidatus Niyogibacteria bacterium RIFCSPLOWO2_12_FULL_41_13]